MSFPLKYSLLLACFVLKSCIGREVEVRTAEELSNAIASEDVTQVTLKANIDFQSAPEGSVESIGLHITRDLNIVADCDGPSAPMCSISLGGSDSEPQRAFRLSSLALVTMSDLNITGGEVTSTGTNTQLAGMNREGDSGAAISLLDAACCTCHRCIFHNNKASWGGAVHLLEEGLFTCIGCTFASNRAKLGGAVRVRGSQDSGYAQAVFIDTTFYDNTATEGTSLEGAGGAVHLFSKWAGATFIGCTFAFNVAENYGGVVYVQGSKAVFSGCQWQEGNMATRREGNYVFIDALFGSHDGVRVYPWPLEDSALVVGNLDNLGEWNIAEVPPGMEENSCPALRYVPPPPPLYSPPPTPPPPRPPRTDPSPSSGGSSNLLVVIIIIVVALAVMGGVGALLIWKYTKTKTSRVVLPEPSRFTATTKKVGIATKAFGTSAPKASDGGFSELPPHRPGGTF